jgi:hypothetical protein
MLVRVIGIIPEEKKMKTEKPQVATSWIALKQDLSRLWPLLRLMGVFTV